MRRVVRLLMFGAIAFAIARFVLARRRLGAPRGTSEGAQGAPLAGLRGFATHRFDPLVMRLGLAGGARSPWGIVEHVGRTSGRIYRTPVTPLATGDGFEIPLPYGADVHWVANILKAGCARLQLHEMIYELDQPQVVEAEQSSLPSVRRRLGRRRRYDYLRLHTFASMSGTFSHLEGHAAPITHGEPVPMAAEGPFAGLVPPAAEGTEVPVEPGMVERPRTPELVTAD